jgi:sucrose phosphorylase
MLEVRSGTAAFHPNGGQEILDLHPSLFALRRTSCDGLDVVTCLQNVANRDVVAALLPGRYIDLLGGEERTFSIELKVESYQVLWLRHLWRD